jgi:hypothetical protein
MNNEQEIESLVEQLKSLQIQQTNLLNRLETLTEIEARRPNNRGPAYQAGNEEPARPEDTAAFAVGDRVRIKNPRPLQQQVGVITKIGPKLITVTTRNGSEIRRAPKNLLDNSA